ncbi:hypothetical protein HDU90_005658 [Geranomyces variabilis]|nr:hypothetical protein HDU90_005658 [Geranomyces variabilis]
MRTTHGTRSVGSVQDSVGRLDAALFWTRDSVGRGSRCDTGLGPFRGHDFEAEAKSPDLQAVSSSPPSARYKTAGADSRSVGSERRSVGSEKRDPEREQSSTWADVLLHCRSGRLGEDKSSRIRPAIKVLEKVERGEGNTRPNEVLQKIRRPEKVKKGPNEAPIKVGRSAREGGTNGSGKALEKIRTNGRAKHSKRSAVDSKEGLRAKRSNQKDKRGNSGRAGERASAR